MCHAHSLSIFDSHPPFFLSLVLSVTISLTGSIGSCWHYPTPKGMPATQLGGVDGICHMPHTPMLLYILLSHHVQTYDLVPFQSEFLSPQLIMLVIPAAKSDHKIEP